MPPFFSVIVVCRNPGLRLHAALASIWAQRDTAAEVIVIDGASTDGSREWLESQRARITTLICEPDRGVYDAMNKGLAAARGEWMLFLGADDRFEGEEVLSHARHAIEGGGADVAVGEAIYEDGRVYRLAAKPNPLARNFVHHQATFYRRPVFTAHGDFDASLSIMGDYDLNLRLWKGGARFVALPLRIASCGTGGLSDAGRWRGYAEEIRVRHRHFAPWQCWGWDALSALRWMRKQLHRPLRPSRGLSRNR
jgi:putative colanic acid biosynthesis glycosyltransferase